MPPPRKTIIAYFKLKLHLTYPGKIASRTEKGNSKEIKVYSKII
jgi:hypothetical protein